MLVDSGLDKNADTIMFLWDLSWTMLTLQCVFSQLLEKLADTIIVFCILKEKCWHYYCFLYFLRKMLTLAWFLKVCDRKCWHYKGFAGLGLVGLADQAGWLAGWPGWLAGWAWLARVLAKLSQPMIPAVGPLKKRMEAWNPAAWRTGGIEAWRLAGWPGWLAGWA